MTKTKTVNGGNTAERIRKSIRNSVANLIKIRYRHSGITSTTNEEGETTTRTYKRTYHTLSDIVIRVFDSLIDKMVQITRNAGKKTIGVDTFVAAMKLLPTIVMPDDGEWDKFIDAVLSKADKIVETIPSGKAQKRERGISNLNAALEADGCFIRGTSLSALVRSKIPFDWRVGGGNRFAVALGVFASSVAEMVLEKILLPPRTEGEKTQPLAPRHIAQSLYKMAGLSHLFKDSVVIGTPLSHLPDQTHATKRARRYKPRKVRQISPGFEEWSDNEAF
jgi:hypothetical protein